MKHYNYGYPFKSTFRNENDITIEHVEKCYLIIANIVQLHGDKYLPIFIRIHTELEKRKKRDAFKKIALQVANDNS